MSLFLLTTYTTFAARLNASGLKSNKGNACTRSSISWIRHKHKIARIDNRKPGERTVQEVSQQFGVSAGVVYDWIARKLISARRRNGGSPYWITVTPAKEQELAEYVRVSPRINSR